MFHAAPDCFPIPCITFDDGLLETLPIIAVIGFVAGVTIVLVVNRKES